MRAPAGAPTLLYLLYRGASAVLMPLAWRQVRQKLAAAGISPGRQRERLGHATLARPGGRLIWFHAASVGESLSVLSLIARMGERLPKSEFLITSGTATSAELIARRLPPRTRHQFAPLDGPGPVRRFYRHWRPDAGILVESELWPRLIVSAGMPLALLNARLSRKSVDGWKRAPATARFILGQFRLLMTQNRASADNLIALGAPADRVRPGSNLKALSAPLPVDAATLAALRARIGPRPVWVASSTHAGEEEPVLAAHRRLLARHPDLLLLLVPRHPDRSGDVSALIGAAELRAATRSRGEDIAADTQVYLADTLGETGTWYALCRLVFLGGSLRNIGGHNPFEPAQAGAAVISGPGHHNFAETYREMYAAGAAVEVATAAELAAAVDLWLTDYSAFEAAGAAARTFARTRQSALDAVVDTLCASLGLDAPALSSC